MRYIVQHMRETGWDCIVQPAPYIQSPKPPQLQISGLHTEAMLYCVVSVSAQEYCNVLTEGGRAVSCENLETLKEHLSSALQRHVTRRTGHK